MTEDPATTPTAPWKDEATKRLGADYLLSTHQAREWKYEAEREKEKLEVLIEALASHLKAADLLGFRGAYPPIRRRLKGQEVIPEVVNILETSDVALGISTLWDEFRFRGFFCSGKDPRATFHGIITAATTRGDPPRWQSSHRTRTATGCRSGQPLNSHRVRLNRHQVRLRRMIYPPEKKDEESGD